MTNESPSHDPQQSESNFPFYADVCLQVSDGKIRYLCVDRFSEREHSRQLAAVCNQLLLALTRDFGMQTPKAITIVPSESTRGVELRILGRD